jgi:hypothetical protein
MLDQDTIDHADVIGADGMYRRDLRWRRMTQTEIEVAVPAADPAVSADTPDWNSLHGYAIRW